MKIIYTNNLERAFTITKALGNGIRIDQKVYKGEDIDAKANEIKSFATDEGLFKTAYNGTETIVTWGSGIKVKPENQMEPVPKENEGFFPDALEFVEREGLENEATRLKTLFSAEDNDTIYDASEGIQARIVFTDLLQYAGVFTSRKNIRRVEIESYDKEGIIRAFDKAWSVEDTQRQLTRDMLRQKVFYTLDRNMKLFYPDQAAYPNAKDLPLLAHIVNRTDQINEEEAKARFYVFVQATLLSTGEIIHLTNTKLDFTTSAEAEEFCKTAPAEAVLTVETTDSYEHCLGPHNVQSLIAEAKKVHHYNEDVTRNILVKLSSGGYIKNASSNKRTIPESEIDNVRRMIKTLAKTTTIVPNYLKDKIDKAEIEKSCINMNDNKSGILLTSKPLDNRATETEKNIYILIAKEIVKLIAGRKKVTKTKTSVTINEVPFTSSGTKLIYSGFSALERPIAYKYDFPDDIKDGEQVRILMQKGQKTVNPPQPYKLSDTKKKFTAAADGEIAQYEQDEFDRSIESLINKEFLILKGDSLYATTKGCEAIHYLNNFDGLIAQISIWDTKINSIKKKAETSLSDAVNAEKNTMTSIKKYVEKWITDKNEVSGLKTDILCPKCGSNMVSNSKGLSCNSCNFKVDRIIFGRRHENKELRQLLTQRTTRLMPGYIKNDQPVYGRIYLDENFTVYFTEDSKVGCPTCKTKLRTTEKGYYCPNCSFTLKTSYLGYKLKPTEMATLLQRGMTPLLVGLKVKGKTINGALYLDKDDCNKVKCIEVNDED